jgi:hypothetical protein
MNFYRRHWYDIGGLLAIFIILYLIIFWDQIEILQRLLILNFVALLIHQFEEYRFPGGEPAIMNVVLRNSPIPDRFPLNQNSAMITNVFLGYPLYLIPVFFPHVIWLGLIPVLFGFVQLMIHGILTPFKIRYPYNPGLGAVIFMHIPIGFYYIYMVYTKGLVVCSDWIFAIIGLIAVTVLGLYGVTYVLLPNKNSKYAFGPEEFNRFKVVERIERNRSKVKF